MDQQRLKAYLGLIQELLTCPSGEEWIRLRQHEDLVDAGFVQTLEQVATTLAHEGDLQVAKYLHNWAGQLHHILSQPAPDQPAVADRSQTYLELIQALLNASPQQQQALIAANQALITPALVQMMRQVSAQLAAQGETATATYLNNLATELGKLWLQNHQFERPATSMPEAVEPSPPPFKADPKPAFKVPAPVAAASPDLPPSPPEDNEKPADLPDPWLEQLAPSPISSTVVPPPPPTPAPPSDPADIQSLSLRLQHLETQLSTLTTTLAHLQEHQAQSAPPANPLWHLEALERACDLGWVLTSEEVERLIHVKPKASDADPGFDRGNWRFVKVGKLGAQTGWRVEKRQVS